jgi:hypothetical protein
LVLLYLLIKSNHIKTIEIKALTFNAGIISLRATLPEEIFTGDFAS